MNMQTHLELERAISEMRHADKFAKALVKNSGGKCFKCGKKATQLHFIGKDLKCLMNYLFQAVCDDCHDKLHEGE